MTHFKFCANNFLNTFFAPKLVYILLSIFPFSYLFKWVWLLFNFVLPVSPKMLKIFVTFFVFFFSFFGSNGMHICSTFSVLRHFHIFDLCNSTRLLRPLFFDLLSNLDFLLVDKYKSMYSIGRILL